MSKSRVRSAMLAMMALSVSDPLKTHTTGRSVPTKSEKPVPKGCKRYYFTRTGNYEVEGETWNDIDYVYNCVASSPKVAEKKFSKWKSKQLNQL